MKKVVILGCENSHASTFLLFIKNEEKFKDVEVVGVYSTEEEPCKNLNEVHGVPILSSYDEMVGKVDGVIVTARHGDNHFKYAKPYIDSGVPMFIDKPITVSTADALEFMKLCKKAGVMLCGGSSCKHVDLVKELKEDHIGEVDGKTIGGLVRAPISMQSVHGGFYFYAEHLVDMVCEIFGRYPKSVKAYAQGLNTTVVFRYEGYDVIGLFVEGVYSCYYAQRISSQRVKGQEFSMSPKEPYYREFDEFYELLHGGKGADYKDFIAPVFIMNAIMSSLETGEEVAIKNYEI